MYYSAILSLLLLELELFFILATWVLQGELPGREVANHRLDTTATWDGHGTAYGWLTRVVDPEAHI